MKQPITLLALVFTITVLTLLLFPLSMGLQKQRPKAVDYAKKIAIIKQKTKGRFQPASEEDLQRLRAICPNEEVLTFYRKYEPQGTVEGMVRLWSIVDILQENSEYVPGCELIKHNYVTFASTLSGDAYCFDLNMKKTINGHTPRITLFAHDIPFENRSKGFVDSLSKTVAMNLDDFLQKFIDEKIDEECRYP